MFRPTPRKNVRPPALRAGGFTLIELLTVIAIIGVLAAILVPVVGSMRTTARRVQCASNLRQIGSAFNLYAADNRGFWPAPRKPDAADLAAPYSASNPPPWANPSNDNWQVEISRYIYRDANMTVIKRTGVESNIAHCPAYDRLFPDAYDIGSTVYRSAGYGMNFNLNVGGANLNTGVLKKQRFRAATLNHPASTILVGDSSDYHLGVDTASWTVSENDPGKPDGYASGAPYRHGANANYLYIDGHVAALAPDAALVALRFKP
jgi:general secretion pathway protein G